MRQTDVGEEQRCCSLAEERQKKKQRKKHREVKSSFPMLYCTLKDWWAAGAYPSMLCARGSEKSLVLIHLTWWT